MKKTVKIFLLMLTVIVIASSMVPVFANEATTQYQGANFSPGNLTGEGEVPGTVVSAGNQILAILRVVGVIIAVAVLIILGIKYMMGSAEEKAEYKKTLVPYVIGVILVAGAIFIATMVFQWAGTLTPG